MHRRIKQPNHSFPIGVPFRGGRRRSRPPPRRMPKRSIATHVFRKPPSTRRARRNSSAFRFPSRSARRRRLYHGRGRHLLHARPRLRFHRDDIRDASDQGGPADPAWHRQRLAREADAARGNRTASSGIIDPPKDRTAATSAPAPAAVEHGGTEISLVRNATVISYGAQADGIVTIAPPRRRCGLLRSGAGGLYQRQLHAGAQSRMG